VQVSWEEEERVKHGKTDAVFVVFHSSPMLLCHSATATVSPEKLNTNPRPYRKRCLSCQQQLEAHQQQQQQQQKKEHQKPKQPKTNTKPEPQDKHKQTNKPKVVIPQPAIKEASEERQSTAPSTLSKLLIKTPNASTLKTHTHTQNISTKSNPENKTKNLALSILPCISPKNQKKNTLIKPIQNASRKEKCKNSTYLPESNVVDALDLFSLSLSQPSSSSSVDLEPVTGT
jgi:hypothetical protein